MSRSSPPSPLLLQALQAGIAKHNAGDLAGAEAAYRQALRIAPRQPDALHLIGLAAHQARRHQEAVDWVGKAIRANGKVANFHNTLGEAYRALGDIGRARQHYRKAVALDPRHPDANNNLGLLYRLEGDFPRARRHLQAALAAAPGHLEALCNLVRVLIGLQETTEALDLARKIATQYPGKTSAQMALGLAALAEREPQDALEAFRAAHALDPSDREIRTNLATALFETEAVEQAESQFRELLADAPNDPGLLANLGSVLRRQARDDEAGDCFDRALAADGTNVSALIGSAMVAIDQARLAQADDLLSKAVRLAPQNPVGHFNLALSRLLQGHFEAAWDDYEWRWKVSPDVRERTDLPQTVWRGEKIDGGGILVHAEQGAGDNFQFARLLGSLKNAGFDRVVVECPPAIRGLMARHPAVDRCVDWGQEATDCTWRSAMLSLAGAMGLGLKDLPGPSPYLQAAPDRVAAWAERLDRQSPDRPFRVGLSWQGNPKHSNDRRRSCPIDALTPLLGQSGIAFHSLQTAPPTGVMADRITDHAAEFSDFDETAALIANLDLVISVDTAAVHLAGALGRPVWVLLPHAPDWRWMLERDDSPWYPTARLFRQPHPGDWQSVIDQVVCALASRSTTA